MLPAEKKDTIFCALRKFFGPSYFVTALVPTLPLPQEAYVSLRCKKMEVFMDQKKWFKLYFFTDRQDPEPIEEEGTEEGEMGMVLEWFWPITILVIDFHQSMIHHLNTHLHLVILQQLELGKFEWTNFWVHFSVQ